MTDATETGVNTSHEAWMALHQGEYLYSWGYIWECHDECGCTEAQVVDYYQNKVVGNARVPVTAWSGEFHSDREPGADGELAAYRRQLKTDDPEREAAIKWQEGVDYEAR